jgi:hypothetical protein
MTIVRTQYITIAELNEILGVATYNDDDLIKVYEASELLKYHCNDDFNTYTTSNAPDSLKLATAYQIEYSENEIDDEYASSGSSFSIGKYSSTDKTSNDEFVKICPKSRRLLIDGGLTRRIV